MPLLELDGRTAWNNIFTPSGITRWPAPGSPRMAPLAHPRFTPSFKIPPGSTIFTVGSCFARSIESHLARHGFDIPTHRYFGNSHIINKYNPFSILQEFRGMCDATARIPIENRIVQVEDGRWVDLHMHSDVPVSRRSV